nr:MAG TPA: GCN4n coiled coil peptide [Caudoviricetes sp.]
MEEKEEKEEKEEETVSRETFNELEKKIKELEKKNKKLEQTILHANVEEKNENPFKGFSRYDK